MLQTLAHVAQIAGGLVLLTAAGTYLIHRNQHNFNMITSCNQRFQQIMVYMDMVDPNEEDKLKVDRAEKQYVDLCNEQIFYFRSGYLPREVMEEWLESMVEYLPLFDDVTGEARTDCPGLVDPELLKGYPALRSYFVVEGSTAPSSPGDRKALAQRIGKTVRPESVLLVLWRDVVEHLSRPARGQTGGESSAG